MEDRIITVYHHDEGGRCGYGVYVSVTIQLFWKGKNTGVKKNFAVGPVEFLGVIWDWVRAKKLYNVMID